MALMVDAGYIETHILPTLIGPGARYAGVLDPLVLQSLVDEAVAETQQRLSTRFTPTRFTCWLGPGPRPVPPDPNGGEPTEIEPPYLWPNISPSAGFLTWRLRVRPVIELVGGSLRLPGSTVPGVSLQPDWFRVNAGSSEITLMPSYGAAALVMPNLPFGLFNWMQQRIPDAVLFDYRAGMLEDDWARFPQVNRLVGLRAAIRVLPVLSMRVNPTGLTSQSADGLSQSRSSGYAFKDLEERLKTEADETQSQILDAWDGTTALSVL